MRSKVENAMTNGGFRKALLLSLSVHIAVMSLVLIVTPQISSRTPTYTRVDFLGPILGKTAFDFLLENAEPLTMMRYNDPAISVPGEDLEIKAPKKTLRSGMMPKDLGKDMDEKVLEALSGTKVIPEVDMGFRSGGKNGEGGSFGRGERSARKVIYKTKSDAEILDFSGGRDLKIKVKALVDTAGKVKNTEPVSTTGDLRLDIAVAKLVREWIFEPRSSLEAEDEWVVVEVVVGGEE